MLIYFPALQNWKEVDKITATPKLFKTHDKEIIFNSIRVKDIMYKVEIKIIEKSLLKKKKVRR